MVSFLTTEWRALFSLIIRRRPLLALLRLLLLRRFSSPRFRPVHSTSLLAYFHRSFSPAIISLRAGTKSTRLPGRTRTYRIAAGIIKRTERPTRTESCSVRRTSELLGGPRPSTAIHFAVRPVAELAAAAVNRGVSVVFRAYRLLDVGTTQLDVAGREGTSGYLD